MGYVVRCVIFRKPQCDINAPSSQMTHVCNTCDYLVRHYTHCAWIGTSIGLGDASYRTPNHTRAQLRLYYSDLAIPYNHRYQCTHCDVINVSAWHACRDTARRARTCGPHAVNTNIRPTNVEPRTQQDPARLDARIYHRFNT